MKYSSGLNKEYQDNTVINVYNLMFCLAYAMLFFKEVVLDRSHIGDLLGAGLVNNLSTLFQLGFLLICIFILLFLQRYTMREILILAGLLAVFFISAIGSGSYVIFNGMLLIACSKKLNFDKFIRYALYIQSICILFVILLAVSGMINMGYVMRGNDNVIRCAFGFNHPNTLAMLSFQWICEYVYRSREEMGIKKYLIMFVVMFAVYRYTDSNTAVIMSLLLIIATFIYERVMDNLFSTGKLRKIIRVLLVIICIALILVIRYYWMHPERLSATTMVSRINLAKKYFIAYGVNLFGHNIATGTYITIPGFPLGYYYLDNAIAWLMIKFGILVFICYLAAYIQYFRRLLHQGKWNLIFISFAYIIYSISEQTPFILVFNSMLIGFGGVIYKNSGFNQKESVKNSDG